MAKRAAPTALPKALPHGQAQHPAAISPAQSIEWTAKGSRFKHMPKPALRWLLAGPSGSGKSICMQQLLLNHYGPGTWERIYVFAPSVHLDVGTWGPVRKMIQDKMGVDLEREPAFFDEFDPAVVQRLIKNTAM